MVLIFVFLRISLLNDLIDTVYCLYIQYFHTEYIKRVYWFNGRFKSHVIIVRRNALSSY